jgi:hypothetical protein
MNEKKVSLVEMLLIVPLVIGSDLFDLMADIIFLLPIVGQVIFGLAKLFSLIVWAIVQTWMFFRGIRGSYFFVGSIVDVLIPFSQTITIIMTIYIVNNPKSAAVAKVANLASPKGAVKGAAGSGKEAVRGVASGGTRGGSRLAGAGVAASTQYIPYGQEEPDRIGSATRNFAQAKRDEAEDLLTPEAAKDPTERLMKELFYDIEPTK